MAMMKPAKQKLRGITVIYWLLLLYIIAALVWWYISLEQQNREMAVLKKENIELVSVKESGDYSNRFDEIQLEKKRKSVKFISEGLAFLVLTLTGALFVYRAIKKQLDLQVQQENFMMAITHELKTPLSVTRLNLETLQKHTLDSVKREKLIRMTLNEITGLNTIINNILISSQLDASGYKNVKEELDLSLLFHDCIQQFRNRFPEREFMEEIEPDIDLTGDDLLLQIMINNLLDNAVKYSPPDKPIHCLLYKKKGKIQLALKDEGTGIDAGEKNKVFEKFYRPGNELTRKTRGTGLGLYLCRKIAHEHNADISVTNNEPSGSIFVITFDIR